MSKISIITAVYNAENTIERCIKSVLSQKARKNIEHIVVDGRSTDRTKEIIKKYFGQIDIFISEKDKNLYDALNKGIKAASGELIGILHSDDYYIDENVLSKVTELVKDENFDAYSFGLNYVDRNGRVKRKWDVNFFRSFGFKWGWIPAHPSIFFNTSVVNKFGLYDTSFCIASDYEYLFRVIKKGNIRVKYFNKPIMNMEIGGKSNNSLGNIIKGNSEIIKIWRRNTGFFPWMKYFTGKLIIRGSQILVKYS